MSAPKVRIGELRLRVPAMTREQARDLGQRVAERLAETGLSGPRDIPALTVRIPAGGAPSVERLTQQIVDAIRSRSKS